MEKIEIVDLDSLEKVTKKWVFDTFKEYKEISLPTWFCQRENGDIVMVNTPFDGVESKNMALIAIKKIFKEHDICRYCFVSETWVVEQKTGPSKCDLPPSQHPDREEAVIMVSADRDLGIQHMFTFKIDRSGGKVVLKDDSAPKFDLLAGRMVDIFPPRTIN